MGIALGITVGSWFARTEKPKAQATLTSDDAPYEVSARAYRPPVRHALPSAAPVPKETATPSQFSPNSIQTEPVTEAVRREAPVLDAKPAPVEGASRQASTPAVQAVTPPRSRGETPKWLANAAVTPAIQGRPMIALVIDDLGLSQSRALRTIGLPAPLTLAFLPYGHNLRKLADNSRRAGHELIIHVNMEPKDRDVDPGPKALLTSLSIDEVHSRLKWALGQFDGYIGISNHMGSRFTEWPEGMEAVVRILKPRGLLFFDSVTSTKSVGAALARAHGLAHASRDIFLDHDRSADAVARQLAATERLARRRGYAIAIGHPYDVTLEALKTWMPAAVKRGFVLVPLSAIVRRRLGEG
jgi:polysaccharide deacetylase 2 family uncharacterized protein YibQ